MEFEDFSQRMNRAASDSSLGAPSDGRTPARSRAKLWPFSKKNKVGPGALGRGPRRWGVSVAGRGAAGGGA